MFESIRGYLYGRRRTLAKTAGLLGGLYLLARYIMQRIEEVREKVIQDRLARDGLKRRFTQTQEDISYTILALMPTLGHQILEQMDVEAITHELQSRSKAIKSAAELPPLSESSIVSSLEFTQEQDARSDVGSLSLSSFSGQEEAPTIAYQRMESSDTSWVDQLSTQSSQPSHSQQPSQVSSPQNHPQELLAGPPLSDSIITDSSAAESSVISSDIQSTSSSSSSKSKAVLWQEIKILTFTRTLTIMYSVTLLTLFTSIQLTLLGRSKYVQSILQQERDERLREKLSYGSSVSSLFWGGLGSLLDLQDMGCENDELQHEITDDVENKYLTLSYWILHVGWKNVAERVQRGVEEVFDSVSLKSKLGVIELHRLVSDVRRRIEHEITFEGTEKRTTFTTALLPPTTEMMQHILIQGGIAPALATAPPHKDTTFMSLVEDTQEQLASPDFEQVLEKCLDRATQVLFDGLEKNIFDETVELDEGGIIVSEPRIRLASLLPGLARWSHLALNGLPNELVDSMMAVKEVGGLSAIMFSGFEDQFRNQ